MPRVEHHGFELLAPLTYDADVSGARRYSLQPEIEYGVLANTQVSIKLPLGAVDSAGSDRGIGGLQFSPSTISTRKVPRCPRSASGPT